MTVAAIRKMANSCDDGGFGRPGRGAPGALAVPQAKNVIRPFYPALAGEPALIENPVLHGILFLLLGSLGGVVEF